MVFYRKYRPQTFADLIGQDQVSSFLLKSLEAGKVSHAYLFTGSKGTGKTSTARILAKSLNCTAHPEGTKAEVCGNVCDNCKSIAAGSFPDLIEIDAASNRGIDEIRDLREKAALSTSIGDYKVYIIDEVHMLTNEAFNALLKLLEEPPTHVVFVLATTELHKIPATILSRTQKYEFKRASHEAIFQYLKKIAESEKLDYEEEALHLIARSSDGSFRDSAKCLEQLSAAAVSSDRVREALGIHSARTYQELLESIIARDAAKTLEILESLSESSVNAKEFTSNLLEQVQGLVLIKSNLTVLAKKKIPEDVFKTAEAVAKQVSLADLMKLSELLITSLNHLQYSPLPFLPLQVASLKFIHADEFAAQQRPAPIAPPAPLATSKPILHVETDTKKEVDPLDELDPLSIDTTETPIVAPAVSTPEPVVEVPVSVAESRVPDAPSAEPLSPEADTRASADLGLTWLEMLKLVRTKNISLEALLRSTEPVGMINDELTIKIFYAFHKEKVNETRNYVVLKDALNEAFGRPINVKFVMGEKPQKPVKEEIAESKNVVPISDDNLLSAANDIFSLDIN